MPAPFVLDKSWRPIVDTGHQPRGWAIVGLAGLHAAAALYHRYGPHDGVLRRMMPGKAVIRP